MQLYIYLEIFRRSAITLENVDILKDFSDQRLCCS